MTEIKFTILQLEMIDWALGGMDVDLYPPPQYNVPFELEDLPELLEDQKFRRDLIYRLVEQGRDMALTEDENPRAARNQARAGLNAGIKIQEAYS